MNVLFVCTGNTCRSPMLKFMFEKYLSDLGISDITVDSAGIMRHTKPMSEECAKVLASYGIPFDRHVSKFCDEELIKRSDIVLTMESSQQRFLDGLYGNKYKIIPIRSAVGADVPDPYGKGIQAYEATYALIERSLPKLLDYLTK